MSNGAVHLTGDTSFFRIYLNLFASLRLRVIKWSFQIENNSTVGGLSV